MVVKAYFAVIGSKTLRVAFNFVSRAINYLLFSKRSIPLLLNLHFRRMYVILQSSSILRFFTMLWHQFCREFSIASIKHQKARSSKERVPQMAQHREIFEHHSQSQSVSKTTCRGFKSYCPCNV